MKIKGALKIVLQLLLRILIIVGIVGLGIYWNRLFEALLVLVAILQFELAYRQFWFNRVRMEPMFAIYAVEEQDKNSVYISIENVSSVPAYLLGVSRVLCNYIPLSPEEWIQHIKAPRHSCLKPSSEGTLAIVSKRFYEGKFIRGSCVMEVSYVNYFGEWKSFLVAFHELTPIIVSGIEKPPGFLLSIGDYIAMLRGLRRLQKFAKRVK